MLSGQKLTFLFTWVNCHFIVLNIRFVGTFFSYIKKKLSKSFFPLLLLPLHFHCHISELIWVSTGVIFISHNCSSHKIFVLQYLFILHWKMLLKSFFPFWANIKIDVLMMKAVITFFDKSLFFLLLGVWKILQQNLSFWSIWFHFVQIFLRILVPVHFFRFLSSWKFSILSSF